MRFTFNGTYEEWERFISTTNFTAAQGPAFDDREKAPSEGSAAFRDKLRDDSLGPEMVCLPAGSFLMGSPEGEEGAFDDERPQHEVHIGRPFAIGRYPVTFDEYDLYCLAKGLPLPGCDWGRGRRPVGNVSWDDAVAYCDWLAEQTGRPYRLPSEAEWEYACRAGTRTRWSCGDDIGTLGDYAWFDNAWFDRNLDEQTHPVGEKRPNPWDLHDMHGNVWEWVQDGWHDNYQGAPDDGRAWEDAPRKMRVLRGGSWRGGAVYLRSAYRTHGGPGVCFPVTGFRIAVSL